MEKRAEPEITLTPSASAHSKPVTSAARFSCQAVPPHPEAQEIEEEAEEEDGFGCPCCLQR